MGPTARRLVLGAAQLILTVDFALSCNIFDGSWVLDNGSDTDSPPALAQCPFIDSGLNCIKNGRPDKMYLRYRWQPTDCDISRFNGVYFLEKNRGKKVMFVGDSLSNTQWQSLGCMLLAAAPNLNYTFTSRGRIKTVVFSDYNVTIMYMKNGFLVSLTNRTLVLDVLSGSKLWNGNDVLVFNSYHWWLHTKKYKTWDNYQIGNQIVKDMDVMEAFRIALTTWANWADSNVNPNKTRLFFQGISMMHSRGSDWNESRVLDCKRQTVPLNGSTYPGVKPAGDEVIRSVLSKMKRPAFLLDILLLTQLRKDGHQSIYVGMSGKTDCSHWCLPGVPDTWNQLMYTVLM